MADDVETRIARIGRGVPIAATLRADALTAPASPHIAAGGGTREQREEPSLPRMSLSLGVAERANADQEYLVTGTIGEGGMGSVLVAHQRALGREVAIKTTKPDAVDLHREALLHEGRVMGRLEHPSIVPVHALGVADDGRPVLVMKRVHGTEWSTLLKDPSHPGWRGWGGDPGDRLMGHLNILQRVADALRYAHSEGVVHCDIKPDNVLIGEYGDAYLADWGIAVREASVPEHICGTPTFMAPEMVDGSPLTRRTDVYLLGAVLHVLLTGRPRHDATTAEGAIRAAWLSEPADYESAIPSELAEIANRACHRDPDFRYASVGDFQEALREFLRHRDSVRLAEEAHARFEQSRTVDVSDSESRRGQELEFAAARFGFEQALALWPSNTVATEGLRDIERLAEDERARVSALEQLAEHHDPRISSTLRAGLLAAQAVIGIVAGLYLAIVRPPLPDAVIVGVPIACLIVGGTAVFVLRDRIWTTAFNRRTLMLLAVMLSMMTLHRVSTCWVTEQPIADVLMGDAFIIGLTMFLGSITLLPWLAWVGLLAAAVGLATAAWPEQSIALQGLLVAGSTGLAAIFSWGERAAARL